METIKSLLGHDIVERSIKTFAQAFLASMLVTISGVSDLGTAKAALLAATAAGASAVWNSIVQAGRK